MTDIMNKIVLGTFHMVLFSLLEISFRVSALVLNHVASVLAGRQTDRQTDRQYLPDGRAGIS
jgi:hypothetical protein